MAYDYFTDANLYVSQGKYEGSVQVHTGRGRFLGGTVFNFAASPVYFQVFDSDVPVSDGYNGVFSILVPPTTSISLDFTSFHGILCGKGIYFCSSSTQPNKTSNGNNLNVTLFWI